MHGAKAGKAGQHPAGAAQLEIGAPDIEPVAGDGDPALHLPDVGKSQCCRFGPQGGLEPGGGDEEDLERRGRIEGRRLGIGEVRHAAALEHFQHTGQFTGALDRSA